MDKVSAEPHFAAAWLEQFGDRLFAYALSRVGGDASVAEDLVQEALLAGIRNYGQFKGESRLETWLIAILRRKVLDHYRAHYSRADEVSLEEFFTPHGHMLDLAKWGRRARQSLDHQEFMEVLDSCVEGLPAMYREAFVLCTMDELSTQEACKVLGISATNLSVRLHRARLSLRRCLQAKWFGGK